MAAETRETIYSYAFEGAEIGYRVKHDPITNKPKVACSPSSHYNLLLVCRKITEESRPLLYTRVAARFDSPRCFQYDTIPPTARNGYERYTAIKMPASCFDKSVDAVKMAFPKLKDINLTYFERLEMYSSQLNDVHDKVEVEGKVNEMIRTEGLRPNSKVMSTFSPEVVLHGKVVLWIKLADAFSWNGRIVVSAW